MNGHEYGGEILPSGFLELRDPSNNTRHQYRVEAGLLFRKRLPDGDQGEGEREEPKWVDGKSIPCGNGNQSGVID